MSQPIPDDADLNRKEQEIYALRQEKARKWREKGVNPWSSGYRPKNLIAAILEKHGKQTAEELEANAAEYEIAGRMMALRSFGKAAFIKVRDRSGEIQVHVKQDALGPGYELFKLVDVGDFIGVAGKVFRSKTGELTIAASRLLPLSKSLRPLPEKWHGLTDVETRYRQRYLDLIANPQVKATFLKRNELTRFIRRFLDEREFVEVETPMMHTLVSGAIARPFTTHHNALDIDLFMRIAPELHLKRLVVELGGDPHEQVDVERVVVGGEWPGDGATDQRVHHRRFDLDELPLVEKAADEPRQLVALEEGCLDLRIGDEIEISLPIARFDIGEAVPFFGQRPERLAERQKARRGDGQLPGLGAEHLARDADEVSDVDQLEKLVRGSQRVLFHVHLDLSGAVPHLDERRLPEGTKGHHPTGDLILGGVRLQLFGRLLAVLLEDGSDQVLRAVTRAPRIHPLLAPLPGLLLPKGVDLLFLAVQVGIVGNWLTHRGSWEAAAG